MDIMSNLWQDSIAKRLLVKAGIIKENTLGAGEVVQKLSSADMKEYYKLEVLNKELNDLMKQKAELDAAINAKAIHLRARRMLWWGEVRDKYSNVDYTAYTEGAYIDRENRCIRKGIIGGTRYQHFKYEKENEAAVDLDIK